MFPCLLSFSVLFSPFHSASLPSCRSTTIFCSSLTPPPFTRFSLISCSGYLVSSTSPSVFRPSSLLCSPLVPPTSSATTQLFHSLFVYLHVLQHYWYFIVYSFIIHSQLHRLLHLGPPTTNMSNL